MRFGVLSSALLLLLASLAPPAAAERCDAEDNTGGLGGQSVACTFSCGESHRLRVFVEAVDEDAKVSGTVRCAGITAHCTGEKQCEALRSKTRVSGTATCSGSSKEFADSGIYVECDSEEVTDPGVLPVVCIGGICTGALAPACGVAPIDCEPKASQTSVRMWVVGELAWGLSCRGEECVALTPTCFVAGGIRTCEVSLSSP